MTGAVFAAVGGVVVQGDEFDVGVRRGEPAGVVLEAEFSGGGDGEVGEEAVEAPDDGAGSAVDFVQGAGVARRDEVVARGVFGDAVDVEVVPGVGAIVTRAGLARIQGQDGFCDGAVRGCANETA